MPMDTQGASAITRSARKLRDLAHDTIALPTPAELYQRKVDELHAARTRRAQIVARQLKAEANYNICPPAIIQEKEASAELIERLERESGILAETLRAQRPKPELTAEQKIRAQAVAFHPPTGKWQPGTPEELKEARAELDAIAAKCREARLDNNSRAEARMLPAYFEARAKVLALEGPPLGEHGRQIPADVLKAALKARGVA